MTIDVLELQELRERIEVDAADTGFLLLHREELALVIALLDERDERIGEPA